MKKRITLARNIVLIFYIDRESKRANSFDFLTVKLHRSEGFMSVLYHSTACVFNVLTDVVALECEAPSRVFQRSSEVFNLFGSSVRYLMGKIRNPQFVNVRSPECIIFLSSFRMLDSVCI